MMTLWQDLRFGLRVLWKSPGFTAVAVLTLGLGVGVNTAIFSGVSAFLLRPLPGVREPERVVALYEANDEAGFRDFSYPDYLDYREQTTSFEGVAGHRMIQAAVGDEAQADVVWGQLVTANFFDVLGVKMRHGRGFLPEEDKTPAAVVVLGQHLWRERFNGDPNVVGRVVQLNGRPFTVVGVAAEEFTGAKWALRMDFFVPASAQEQVTGTRSWLGQRDSHWLSLMGRLKPGVTLDGAAAEMSTIARRLEEAYPEERPKGAYAQVVTEQESRFEDVAGVARLGSGMALAVVVLVLLIACANVANLQLARAVSRGREIGIRLALGASRGRIVRQLLTESLLLAAAGGALGLLLSFWLTDLMTAFFPTGLPYAIAFSVAPDARALLYTLAVTMLTGLAFGLAPALQASKPDLIPVLKGEGALAQTRKRRLTARNALVVAQVALSLVVLVCAGLFVKSFRNARHVDVGFEPEGIVTAALDPGLFGYTKEQGREFYRQLVERVRAVPGVEGAAAAYLLPLGDSSTSWGAIYPAEQPPPAPGEGMTALVNIVTPGYFDALRIPLVAGRDFDTHDLPGANVEAAVVNQTMAARLWPGQDPLGRRLKVGRDEQATTLEVVGVARDGKYRTLGEGPRSHLYVSQAQTYQSGMRLVVRAKGDPAAVVGALRQAAREVDARVPLYQVKTMREHLTWALWAPTMAASLATAFGLLALALAATGLYSLLAYTVSQRTHEIGIRMALGARRRDILRLVARQGMTLALVGLGLGLVGALLSARLVASLLYGVSPNDAAIFLGIAVALALVALVACLVPARRATKVDPMVALRYE